MFGVLRLRAGAEWRRHWVSLLALTVLIGFSGAVVLATVAGARRTRSTVDRLDLVTRIPNAFMLFDADDFSDADKVLALPEVAGGARVANPMLFQRSGYVAWVAGADGQLGRDVARERITRGRRPDPGAALEVALPERVAREAGVGVGDRLVVNAPGPEQVPCILEESSDPACVKVYEIFGGSQLQDLRALTGPEFSLRVVGLTRGVLDSSESGVALSALSPAFFQKFGDTVPYRTAVMVRYRAGVTDAEFERALARVVPTTSILDFGKITPIIDSYRSTNGVLANGLLVFSLVAAAAATVAVSQALSRQLVGGRADRAVLAGLGASNRTLVMDSVAPLVPVAVAGAVLAVLGAWLASVTMPISAARRLEPNPGLDVDLPVLLGGGALLVVGVLGLAFALAGWLIVRNRADRGASGSRIVPLGSAPVAMTIGARLAVDPGRGSRAVPVRSAMAGTAVAVAGLVAVLVFAGSLDRLVDSPARYGYRWDLSISGTRARDGNVDLGSAETRGRVEREIVDHPAVTGLSQKWFGLRADVAGQSVTGFAERPIEGETGFVIVTGRAPSSDDEVALGRRTMQRAGVSVGDPVAIEGRRTRVVGQAVFPATADGYALADGALFTEGGMNALGLRDRGDEWSTGYGVRLRPGTDRDAVAGFARWNDGDVPTRADRPDEVNQLARLRGLPRLLAGFLILLGLLAVGHALVLTVRRRTTDLAVIRVLGCTPGQTSRTVAWQATTLSGIGLVVGVPLGVVIGRAVWAEIASAYGVAADVFVEWSGVALIVLGAVVLANVIAFWPGRHVARIRPAAALRSE